MKIVYCFRNISKMGGMQRIITSKANYFVKAGNEVIILSTEEKNVPYYDLNPKIKITSLGINYNLNRERPFLKKIFYFFYNKIIHKKRLKDFINKENPDIVISVFENDMAILPYIKHRCKKILEFHGSRITIELSKRKNLFRIIDLWNDLSYSRIINKYDRFVLLTKEDCRNWAGINNIQVINNMSFFKYDVPSECKTKKVIAVGRYDVEKGFDRLINAWSLVTKYNKEWTLHIIGDGPLRNNLQKQIDKLNLSEYVFLDGISQDLRSDYYNSSILVMPSYHEGFSLALIEAESAGLPLVSFDVPCGPKEIIKEGYNGFLVKDGDIEGLADKILFLINNDEHRKKMGANAYVDSKKYTEESIMTQWIDLFNSLLKK